MAVLRRSLADMLPDVRANGPAWAGSLPAVQLRAGLELTVVSTREHFEALEPEWNALFDRAGQSIQGSA